MHAVHFWGRERCLPVGQELPVTEKERFEMFISDTSDIEKCTILNDMHRVLVHVPTCRNKCSSQSCVLFSLQQHTTMVLKNSLLLEFSFFFVFL